MEFLVGERLEHLKKSHVALEADELIPAEVMLNTYGKEREHQVREHSGIGLMSTGLSFVPANCLRCSCERGISVMFLILRM